MTRVSDRVDGERSPRPGAATGAHDPTAGVARAWRGSTWIYLAELLLLPTGLITAGVLSRNLGDDGYGLFSLVATLVGWLQWTSNSMLSRATNRSVAASEAWQATAAEAMRLHIRLGLVLGGLLLVLAPAVADFLRQPTMTLPLRVFALDLPLVAYASGARNVLVAIDRHADRARLSALHWLVRLLAIVACIAVSPTVLSAVVALLCASLVDAALCRRAIGALAAARGAQRQAIRLAFRTLAIPVALAAIGMRTFDRADLFLLARSGADAATLGHYGAAQNLTVVLSLLAASVSPVVLSAITRFRRAGDDVAAARVGAGAVSLAWLVLPYAIAAWFAAPAGVALIYGPTFGETADIARLLALGACTMLSVSACSVLLVAYDRAWHVVAAASAMLTLLVLLALWWIPVAGALGAARASLVTALVGGALTAWLVARGTVIRWPVALIGRAMLASAIVAVAGRLLAPASSPAQLLFVGGASLALFAAQIAWRDLDPALLRGMLAPRLPAAFVRAPRRA